jgi:hypothetical protein
MLKKRTITICLFVLAAISMLSSQNYIRLTDASGFNTDAYQAKLEAAAAELVNVFPEEYRDSFKVFDVGFYSLTQSFEGGYPPMWERAIAQAGQLSPYFLLFGKQSDSGGIYTRFWVEIRLPGETDDICSDKEESIRVRLLEILNPISNPFSYAQREIQAMELFRTIMNCEICDNDIDDDGDGFIDCDDLDCSSVLQASPIEKNLNSSCLVLTEAEIACLSEHQPYLEQIGIYDTETAVLFCSQLSELLNAPSQEVGLISNGIEICDIYVPGNEIVPSTLVFETRYRFPHHPPNQIAPDLQYGTDGDSKMISFLNRGQLTWSNELLENNMLDLLHFASGGEYQTVADKFMQRFVSGVGGFYDDPDISELIMQTNEVKNKVKTFGLDFQIKLEEVNGQIELISSEILPNDLRYIFSAANGYLFKGPTILINDVSQVRYHLQSFDIDTVGNWQGIFYVEVVDHFGLDNNDPNHRLKRVFTYQFLNDGFASWWILQHRRNYKPFRTKIKFVICLEGNITISP